MGTHDGLDPTGTYFRAVTLGRKALADDTLVANYTGDLAGLADIKARQYDNIRNALFNSSTLVNLFTISSIQWGATLFST
jgi:hypothetical protein